MRNASYSSTRALRLAAVLLVGICLVPAGAHLFELSNKMALPPAQYMTVQRIYAGWALFGIPISAALAVTAAHTLAVRGDPPALALSLAAFLCLVATQVVFWTFTYPMNAASANWTRMPEDFEAARRQWEYAHAANAVITFLALAAIALSAILARQPPSVPAASGAAD